MKQFLISLSLLTLSLGAHAQELKVHTREIKVSAPKMFEQQDPIATAGQVLEVADRIVAIGEKVYDLVQRGKPNVKTEYAAIAILPRDPISKQIADPLDMEDCSFPVRKKI